MIDYEAEYNVRRRVPHWQEIVARWRADSAAARQGRCELAIPYGPGERQRYDLMHSGAAGPPLVVYIHGGYWQFSGREDVTFVAPALAAAGIDVALPSYPLCPAVSVLEIVDQLRRCIAALWTTTQRRPVVVGHSAGGHLAAAMLATDWRAFGAPADLVTGGVALSGVFELAPLIPTTINGALRLDEETARQASPVLWRPTAGATLHAVVGGDETAEFHRQGRAMAAAWAEAGATTDYLSVAGANHYTIAEELTRPDSEVFRRIATLARAQRSA